MFGEAQQQQRIKSAHKLESVNRWLSIFTAVVLTVGGGLVLYQYLGNLGGHSGKKGPSPSDSRNEIQKTYQHVIEQIQR
jgi:hypothetical protein